MEPVSVTVRQPTCVSPARAFDAIIPIDLPSVFTGHGPLPAVVGVRDLEGAWDGAGQHRTVLLRGGGTMDEELLRVERPGACEYRVVPTSWPLSLLVERIEGRFLFQPAGETSCTVDWTYSFFARPGRRMLLRPLAGLWRTYAKQVLVRAVAAAERPLSDR